MTKCITCPNCDHVFKVDNDLTEREMEVALLIANGLSTDEVGKKLYMSPKTVKNHISNIYRKLVIKDRLALLKYFLRQGIITLDDIGKMES